MKTRFFTFLLIFFNVYYTQTDTLCNPSFEDSLNDWGSFCNGTSIGDFQIDSSAAFSGYFGLKIDVSGIDLPSTCALTSCMLSLQQGKFYKFSFWAKADSTENLLVVLQNSSAPFTNHASGVFSVTNDWQNFSIYSTDSNQLNNVKIKFKPQTDGVYYFDDANLEAINSLPFNFEVCEGDFENGTASWTSSNNGGDITVESETSIVQNGLSSAKVIIANTMGGQPIFSSCKSDIQQDVKYKIHFWIKSEMGGQQVIATSSLSSSPYSNYGQTTVDVSTSWSEHTFITQSDTSVYANVRLAKFKFLNDGNFYLDNIWIEELPPQPIFCDGDFESGLSDWTQTINNGAVASISISPSQAQSGLQSAMVLLNNPGTSNGSVQLSSCKTDIVKDSVYTVSFWVKGSAENLNFNAISALGSAPFTAFSSNAYLTSNLWQEYCYTFSHDSTIISDVRLLKLQFLDAGTYFIDNATINSPDYSCSSLTSSSMERSSTIEIHPNPAQNTLNISNISQIGSEVTVLDMFGKKQVSFSTTSHKIAINVEELPAGVYLLQLCDKLGNLETKRWVKK